MTKYYGFSCPPKNHRAMFKQNELRLILKFVNTIYHIDIGGRKVLPTNSKYLRVIKINNDRGVNK